MIDFEHSAAFAPFMQHRAAFSGRRLESGAAESRSALHAVPCCVLGPTAIDASIGGSASLVARASVCAWQKGTKTMSNDTSLVARASVCAWRAAALPLCRMDAKKDN